MDVFGSFGISVNDGHGQFTEIGSVGSGFSDTDLMLLTTELKRIVDVYDNNTFHFLPRVVIEITADLITRDTAQ